jgi:hypothetical protein
MRLFKSKKGFELQFNWIFVLIAGAIILSFFFLVTRNQIAISKVEDSSKTQQDIDFIFRGSLGSRSSEKPVPITGKLEFSCSDGVSSYIVEGSSNSFQYNYFVIFSPRVLDGNWLYLKTELFKAPFNVMPFIYLSNEHMQFIFINEDDLSKMLFYSLPKNVSKKYLGVPLADLIDDNYDSVILVANSTDVANTHMNGYSQSRQSALSLVVFEPSQGIVNNFGKISFYKYNQSLNSFVLVGEEYYLTYEQLVGAVYSGEASLYSCQFNKSMQRLAMLSLMQKMHVSKLSEKMMSSPLCIDKYSGILTSLDVLNESNKRLDDSLADSINKNLRKISNLNEEIIDETSCPPIY